MFSSKLLCEFRNAIWRIRRAVKNDALEVGSRQRFFCGYYGSSLESLESILFDAGFDRDWETHTITLKRT